MEITITTVLHTHHHHANQETIVLTKENIYLLHKDRLCINLLNIQIPNKDIIKVILLQIYLLYNITQ